MAQAPHAQYTGSSRNLRRREFTDVARHRRWSRNVDSIRIGLIEGDGAKTRYRTSVAS